MCTLVRDMDAMACDLILLARPPQASSWQAVNDRIGRAAAAFNP